VAGLVRSADTITEPQAVLQWLIVTARRERGAWSSVMTGSSRRTSRPTTSSHRARHSGGSRPTPQTARAGLAHIAQLPARCQALLRVIAFADRPDYAAVADSLGMPVGSIGPTSGAGVWPSSAATCNDPGWES